MCSPNSGQRAMISRNEARSNSITSVVSTATQALTVGSPVNAAISPTNVRLSTCAIWTSLPGLRSTNSTRPRSITKNGASRTACSYSTSPGWTVRRRPRLPNHASFASERRGKNSSSRRSGKSADRITSVVAIQRCYLCHSNRKRRTHGALTQQDDSAHRQRARPRHRSTDQGTQHRAGRLLSRAS